MDSGNMLERWTVGTCWRDDIVGQIDNGNREEQKTDKLRWTWIRQRKPQ